MEDRFEAEVVDTHEFLGGWLSGSLPRNAESYAPFAASLADDFMIISPAGEATHRAALLPGLERAHAAEGVDFRIRIENCRLRWSDDQACVGTYEEWQGTSGAQSARLSSVLFRRNPARRNGLEWVHLHETWLAGHAPVHVTE